MDHKGWYEDIEPRRRCVRGRGGPHVEILRIVMRRGTGVVMTMLEKSLGLGWKWFTLLCAYSA